VIFEGACLPKQAAENATPESRLRFIEGLCLPFVKILALQQDAARKSAKGTVAFVPNRFAFDWPARFSNSRVPVDTI
jgi:hypothetical protein